jgi:flagellar biosynthetic protein FliP
MENDRNCEMRDVDFAQGRASESGRFARQTTMLDMPAVDQRPARRGQRERPAEQGRAGRVRRLLRPTGRHLLPLLVLALALAGVSAVYGQPPDSSSSLYNQVDDVMTSGPARWTSPQGLSSALQVMLLLTVLSLAPAVLLMTTSFIRIVVVLGLLRQALGTQQLPPSQVITSLALFMTLLIMAPVWKDVYDRAIVPYTDPATSMSLEEACDQGSYPIRRFMARQIVAADNAEDIHMFYRYLPEGTPAPETFDEVPLRVLLPAYMLSELKTAFLIGFQIYLPFLILDIVVASVTISMGMLMLPPVMISLPFKLMLFVLVDGWHLVVEMLLQSFVPVVS